MTWNAETALRRLWSLLDEQAWDRLPDVLAADVRVSYLHTGEVLDRAGFIELNRSYPGRWSCAVQDAIGTNDRAAVQVRVSDGPRVYYVASFVTMRAGAISDLVEVWTDEVAPAPSDRRPS